MLKKHVVVVGGGWAGIRLVKKLKKLAGHQIQITLVSNEPNFRYSSALYRVATGHKEKIAIIPIHELICNTAHARFIRGTMKSIDPAKRTIRLGNDTTLHYDYAVLALGSVTTYFGIPGIQEHAFSIKTQKELRKFKTHLHTELLNEHAPDKNYIIVGAGPTGVELSASLASYLKATAKRHGLGRRRINIELIEATPRVLPQSHPRASKITLQRLRALGIKVHLNSKVEYETDDSLIVNGRSIQSRTVVWTAGVANSPFFGKFSHIFTLNNRAKVIVDDHLRVNSRLYVIGDNAVTPFSGLGLTAVHNATYVYNDIRQQINGSKKTSAYKPLTPATAVPVGKFWAVFQYRSFVIGGFVGSIIRSIADFVAYNDISGVKKAVKLWVQSADLEEQCVICKSAITTEHNILSNLTETY